MKYITKADVVCASASKILQTEVGSGALVQGGVTMPICALTMKGKEFVLGLHGRIRRETGDI